MKLLATIALALASLAAWADPVITFEKTAHKFGKINADGGAITMEYPFTNTGDKPLVIVNVTNGGCGCTTPQYPVKPVLPGEKGVISITFDPRGRSGSVNRKVLVQTNATKKRVGLTFSGTINAK